MSSSQAIVVQPVSYLTQSTIIQTQKARLNTPIGNRKSPPMSASRTAASGCIVVLFVICAFPGYINEDERTNYAFFAESWMFFVVSEERKPHLHDAGGRDRVRQSLR